MPANKGGLTKQVVSRPWGIAKSKAIKKFEHLGNNPEEAAELWKNLRSKFKGLQIPNKHVYKDILGISGNKPDKHKDRTDYFENDTLSDMEDSSPQPSTSRAIEPPRKRQRGNSQLSSRISEDVIQTSTDEGVYMLPQEDALSSNAVANGEVTSTGGSECVEGTPMASATGNNVLYQGFGGSTSRPNPDFIVVKKTFKRTFTSTINFTKQRKAEMELLLNDNDNGWPNAISDPSIAKFTVNHGGHIIPYWYKQASTKPEDWNLPDEFIGYRIKKFGFNFNNMQLHVINNNKSNTAEVPVTAPPNARIWTFTDVHNDYGIPEHHTKTYARYEECMNIIEYRNLSIQPDRHIYMGSDPAMHMINEGWLYGNNKFTALTPNYIYDMKKHPGYRECVISSGGFALEYACESTPLCLFPGESSHSLDFTSLTGIPKVENYQCSNKNINNLEVWPTHEITVQKTSDKTMATVQTSYFNEQYRHIHYSGCFQNSAGQDLGAPSIADDNGVNKLIKKGVTANNICDHNVNTEVDGSNRRTYQTNRPPMYLIGIYPDVVII